MWKITCLFKDLSREISVRDFSVLQQYVTKKRRLDEILISTSAASLISWYLLFEFAMPCMCDVTCRDDDAARIMVSFSKFAIDTTCNGRFDFAGHLLVTLPGLARG